MSLVTSRYRGAPSSGGRNPVDACFLEDRIIRRAEVTGGRCDERYAKHLDALIR